MSDTYFDLPSRLEDTFLDIESDIIMDLQSSDTEYAALHDRMVELKQLHPFIETVLTGRGEVHLTDEEHAPLVEYLHLLFKREDMERRHIYFRGHTDAFAYLKKNQCDLTRRHGTLCLFSAQLFEFAAYILKIYMQEQK